MQPSTLEEPLTEPRKRCLIEFGVPATWGFRSSSSPQVTKLIQGEKCSEAEGKHRRTKRNGKFVEKLHTFSTVIPVSKIDAEYIWVVDSCQIPQRLMSRVNTQTR